MNLASRKFGTFLAMAGLSAFLLMYLFGANSVFSMEVRKDGKMSGCLFTGKVEVCTMSFASHFAQWQGMFTTTSPKNNSVILLAYLLAWAVIVFASQRSWAVLASEASAPSKFYTKQNFHIPIFNSLKEAFFQGILNPKIYGSAVI